MVGYILVWRNAKILKYDYESAI